MTCPKCRASGLSHVDSGLGFSVDECPECGGRWYDSGELEACVADPEKFKASLAQGMLRPRASDRSCPHCEGDLVNGGLVSELLRVDFCQRCLGFWLDKSELGLVDKLLKG